MTGVVAGVVPNGSQSPQAAQTAKPSRPEGGKDYIHWLEHEAEESTSQTKYGKGAWAEKKKQDAENTYGWNEKGSNQIMETQVSSLKSQDSSLASLDVSQLKESKIIYQTKSVCDAENNQISFDLGITTE